MKIGKCNSCSGKLGARSINRRFTYNTGKLAQISLVFGHPGRPEKTRVHVVVCKDCAGAPRMDAIEANLETDQSFLVWKDSAPSAVLEGYERDVIGD